MNPTICLRLLQELAIAAFAGAEFFFADLDGDGRPEALAYQGPGVFGARLYSGLPQVKPALPTSTCLAAFGQDGRLLWRWGTPHPADQPYTSHAYESCVATGDIDGDGRIDVALADGRRVVLLDGATGRVRAQAELPEDNFYIVQILGPPRTPGAAVLVLKNGEGGYEQWRYGEPILALDAQLKPRWGPVAIPGAGHHILPPHPEALGPDTFLVGYCAMTCSGRIRWTLDTIDPATLDPGAAHVDYTDMLRVAPGRWVIGFAASNIAQLAESGGRTLFSRPGPHVQGCALGRFREDSEFQMAVYNAPDGPLVLYAPDGTELWQRPAPRRWPLGTPRACAGHRFHRNRPIVALPVRVPDDSVKDYVIFSDGGWPWGMDGAGNHTLEFDPPPASRQPEFDLPPRARADDLGYGFATKIVDWDGDSLPEAVIHDRRHLWIYAAGASSAGRR